MYPRIYKRNETDFTHNGYGVLKDLIKCEVIEEDNGMFELEGECTISSFLFEYIQEENIIKAWASEELGEQLFRIYRVQKDLNGYITFNAQHITYDLLDNFIESIELVDVTCENAINEIFNHCAYKTPFKGYSDITHKGSIILQRVNPMEAIKGTRGSICDTFGNGAKVIKDNFNIRVNANRGANNNVLIAYKKNLTGFESEVDTSDLVTAIFPYATIQNEGEEASSDEVIQLPEKYIYSKYHQNYNNLKIMPIDFSGDDVGSVENLRTKANNYFKNSNCDTPKINYKVEFIPLSKTVNYADYKVLETVSMCDKVIVRDYRFDLDVEAQVIKTTHCSLTKKLLSCELGNFKYSLSDVVSDINKEQAEITDKIDKIKVNIDNEIGEIKVVIKDEVEGLQSQITQNAESITTKVSNSDFESYVKQTAEEISSKVSGEDVSSIIRQSSSDIQIGFNGINDRININSNYMAFTATNGNKDMLLYGGQVCVYNNMDNTFMSTMGSILNGNNTLKGVGFILGANTTNFMIQRDSDWDDILTNRAPSPTPYFNIDFAKNTTTIAGTVQCSNLNLLSGNITNVTTGKIMDFYSYGFYAYNTGNQMFTTNGYDMFNCANWDWQGHNILNPIIIGGSYGYSVVNNSKEELLVSSNSDTISEIKVVQSSTKNNVKKLDVSNVTNKDEIMLNEDNVDLSKLVTLLIDEVKKLKLEVEELKSRIN